MSLPPYDRRVLWKDYEIATPTFDLTSVEKPDMSPFLFHMTGRNEIYSILSGGGADSARILKTEPIEGGNGFLKALIPQVNETTFDGEVVCFTESTIFSLDFFRYRNYRRWSQDQMYGIGFQKSRLVSKGVRPCIYPDADLLRSLMQLRSNIGGKIQDFVYHNQLIGFLNRIYSLNMPLLENTQRQGYMWEREWRFCPDIYSDYNGFAFPHKWIKVICCPDDERDAIKALVGSQVARSITFIRSWQEYNEVTEFLKKRDFGESPNVADNYDDAGKIQSLEEYINYHRKTINELSAFSLSIKTLEDANDCAIREINKLEKAILRMEREIQKIKDRNGL